MAIAEVSIIPLGTKTPSVSKYLARAFRALRDEKNIKYELTSMGTIIEGDLGDILRIVRNMHEAAFGDGIMRVVTTIKIDDRRDKPLSMRGKIESLLKKLES
ncbi:MAG: thiamine-binding protein [Dehalococcoidia bacterium]|nr:MAG: thiamine-binding protein [Dehalococcoidia bacterium]